MTKILLVEDDKSLREIYGVRLLAEGYDIISAGDGEAALAMAIKDRPALIVSDVMMPKISGFDMLDILRSTTETRNIKVIMMTALSSDDQRKRGEELGADKYLVKSQVGIEDVVRAVHEVLGDAPMSQAAGSSPPSAPSAPSTPGSSSPSVGSGPRPAPAAWPAPRSATPAAQPAESTSAVASPTTAATSAATQADPDDSALPQPTAPFSTPRTGGLADRVIHPIERDEPSPAVIADQIDKELSNTQVPSDTTPTVSEEAPATPEPAESSEPAPSPSQETPPEQPKSEQPAA